MATDILANGEAKRKLAEALERSMKGSRDPVAMKSAALQMDKMREEIRRRCGTVDLAVELIREARDS